LQVAFVVLARPARSGSDGWQRVRYLTPWGRERREGSVQDEQAQGVGAGDLALRKTAEVATLDAALPAPAFETSPHRIAA
jgi:hypothetical protein